MTWLPNTLWFPTPKIIFFSPVFINMLLVFYPTPESDSKVKFELIILINFYTALFEKL